ncbi:protein ECT2 isoform X2 [Sitophilus oryzae]|uniref:Protein ECT2 isoform X2 n=1 Tax=Sitophilus oryzae TaxID=7048 RepID=A0A6J2XTM7_SITOR|nr:protein ECT2 isoform X2 [Sitophilus oryzae]
MDENNAQIQSQGSVCSDSNGEDTYKNDGEPLCAADRRICLIGNLASDTKLHSVAESFGVPVVTSVNGFEYVFDDSCCTYYIIDSFEGDIYNALSKSRQTILGPTALQQLAAKEKKELPDNTRPLFNIAMRGVVVCFTGFRNKDELTKLVPLIHHMGGSIRRDMTAKVTHLIANSCGGDKYQYASTFKVPVMNLQWVVDSWDHRCDLDFSSSVDSFVSKYKLKPFHGAKVCFLGFPEEEKSHMTEVLEANGGLITSVDDPNCTHVVMENSEVYTLDAANTPLLSPKSNPNLKTFLSEQSEMVRTPNNNSISDLNCLETSTTSTAYLGTVHETSNNDDLVSEMDSICFEDQSLNTSSVVQRKRKFASPDSNTLVKRKREKCYSERRRKVSSFFKTPINYFANRRRTIDASTLSRSMNDSVVSTSGVFNVETLSNLSTCIESDDTPRTALRKSKKSLFSRTFSSSRFTRSKSKKSLMNSSKLSFSDDVDSVEKDMLNLSCFPDISLNPIPHIPSGYSGLSSESSQSARRPALAVVDETSVVERPDVNARAFVVKAEWFWTSVQKEYSLDEKEYLFDDYIEHAIATPGVRRDSRTGTPSSASRRKRKRIHETLQSLVQQTQSPALHKRRSSVSDAGLLSVSGSFLDCTVSPNDKGLLDKAESEETPQITSARHQVFLELVQTESNYVEILSIIVKLFKQYLEEMLDEDPLLNFTELNLIFGKLPPIHETHLKMLDELRWTKAHWNEERSIGDIIIKYSTELQRAYPPFINYFEEMKEVLTKCDQSKPRFHAFLKAMQTRPECGRQSLQELMIRPVQRLGSISLLLNDLLKHTPKPNPDHAALEQAMAALREVMTHINEDKRKTEGQVTLFNIFNDIDNCPPDIVSSHRNYITKVEVTQLGSSDGLSSKGSNLVLFLFSDQLEVCKKKSKAFNSMKSPSASVSSFQMAGKPVVKPYKHVKMMALNTIKRVIDIKETEDCQKVFSLVCRGSDDMKEKLFSFAMSDDDVDKVDFLKTLTRTMANNVCSADADKFMAYLEPQQLDIDTSDLSTNTLTKAFKFAKTRLKVGRTFSFNKSTPSKLKRAVSSMMSPFGSSTNLTPASQLANMRLASYSNINELGNNTENSNDPPPVAPMSVQPTRKVKSTSLNVNTFKRL